MRESFSDDVLPAACSIDNEQKNDFLFTRITRFLEKVLALQKQDKQVENHEVTD